MQMQINFQYQCYLLYQLILTTLALLTIAIHAIQPLLTLPKSKTKQRIMSSLLMILTLHYTKATNTVIRYLPYPDSVRILEILFIYSNLFGIPVLLGTQVGKFLHILTPPPFPRQKKHSMLNRESHIFFQIKHTIAIHYQV